MNDGRRKPGTSRHSGYGNARNKAAILFALRLIGSGARRCLQRDLNRTQASPVIEANVYLGFISFGAVAACSITATAALCARRRAYASYVGSVALLTAAAIAVAVVTRPAYYQERQAIFVAIVMFVPLAAVYLVLPGQLVRKAAAPRKILITTIFVTVIAVPIWLVYDLYAACYLGLDCI